MGAQQLHPTQENVTVALIPATKEDLQEVAYFENVGKNQPQRKVMKYKNGFPFWLKRQSGDIEPTPYLLDDKRNLADVEEYLELGMVFIAKKHNLKLK